MTDLSPTISSLLTEKHSSKPLLKNSENLTRTLDSFLKEATQINRSISSLVNYLSAIRQPYLSTAPPPRRINAHQRSVSAFEQQARNPAWQDIPTHLDDNQREDIDRQTSAVLREINNNINNLSSAVNLQHETSNKVLEKKYGRPSGLLWRWAAGDGDAVDAGKSEAQIEEEGQVKTTKSFREGVLWYLGKGLERAVRAQQDMVGIRLERERQRQMSILYDKSNKGVKMTREVEPGMYGNQDLRGHDEYNPALDLSGHGQPDQELSSEQLQLFEEENKGIFDHYNDQLAKVTQAEKSLIEISSLQQTLVGHLTVQGEMIEQLVEDASRTDENVRRGNKELKKASERSSTAKGVFWGTVGLCSFLIVWDLIF